MPDITMCQNKKCKRREKCYRFIAEADEKYQSYAAFDGTECFLPIPHYGKLRIYDALLQAFEKEREV